MSKEGIVEKKPKNIFEIMQNRHEEILQKMKAMDNWFDDALKEVPVKPPTIINMGNMDTFKNSIETFQKQYPNAKIRASVYVYSTGAEPQIFKYETVEEKPKLAEKVKKVPIANGAKPAKKFKPDERIGNEKKKAKKK